MKPLGTQIGKYTPLMELASGGMATVYVARQSGPAGFGRVVVVKRVHRHLLADRELRSMLLDEARVTSLIRHSNVVSVTDVVESDSELSLIMDYVESASLAALLAAYRKGNELLPPAVACRVVVDALSGLHAAHEARDAHGNKLGIVHRDVSPQNVIVGVDGHSRMIDFGIATAAHRMTQTRNGDVRGKLPYMSPEQLLGKALDRRVDVFAAGIVLHETLTGESLFAGQNDAETLFKLLKQEIPNPSSMAAGVPPALDRVVQKALAREPADRYATTREFINAIECAIVLASPRDVGKCVEAKCWKLLAARRIELRAALHALPGAHEMFDDSLSTTGMTSVVDGDGDAPPSYAVRRPPTLALFLGGAVLVAGVLVGAVAQRTGGLASTEGSSAQGSDPQERTGTRAEAPLPLGACPVPRTRGDRPRRRGFSK